jgi:hypothetical protein
MEFKTREQWLLTVATIINDELFQPNIAGYSPPLSTYSMTAPNTPTVKGGRILGECWSRAASADGSNAIFITAALDESDSQKIVETLIHEMVHAFDDNKHGHGATFAALCRLVGLQGGKTPRSENSYTATTATPKLQEHIQEILETVGQIPHAALTPALNGKKKQKNRQLKVECDECEFSFRTSQKNIDLLTVASCCPACECRGSLTTDGILGLDGWTL